MTLENVKLKKKDLVIDDLEAISTQDIGVVF